MERRVFVAVCAFFLLSAGALFLAGGRAIRERVAAGGPVTVAFAELERAPRDWIRVEGCAPVWSCAVPVARTIGATPGEDVKPTALYVPLGEPPFRVLACVRPEREREVVTTITGTLRRGLVAPPTPDAKLREGLGTLLAGSYVVLDEGREPDLAAGIMVSGFGVLILVAFGFFLRSVRSRTR